VALTRGAFVAAGDSIWAGTDWHAWREPLGPRRAWIAGTNVWHGACVAPHPMKRRSPSYRPLLSTLIAAAVTTALPAACGGQTSATSDLGDSGRSSDSGAATSAASSSSGGSPADSAGSTGASGSGGSGSSGGSGAGRPPRGFSARRGSAPNAAAEKLAQMAQFESASVEAFHALDADLVRLGAPRNLLRAVRAAAKDEIRHARVVGRAAERFGARVPRTRVAPVPRRSLEQLAVDNAEEGCVKETFGAALASIQAARASDPPVRRMMRGIARDELAHAALAWRLAHWLEGRLDVRARARVEEARASAITALELELAQGEPENDRLGLPHASRLRAAFQVMRNALKTGDLADRRHETCRSSS
jgi:hypothetical protein